MRNCVRNQIDQEKLRDYFPTLAAQKWLFAISSDLYGIDFKPVKVKAWQSEVEYYDIVDKKTGKLLGGLYMDKFPREGNMAMPLFGEYMVVAL